MPEADSKAKKQMEQLIFLNIWLLKLKKIDLCFSFLILLKIFYFSKKK